MKNIILISIIILTSNVLCAQDISGTWHWQNDNHVSSITLIQDDANTYYGYYCSSFYEGKKIDCSNSTEICINIEKTDLNIFEGTFESPSFNGTGQIKFTFDLSQNKLKLEIANSEGEYYLPNNVFFE